MYREDARNLQEFSDLRCFVLTTRTSIELNDLRTWKHLSGLVRYLNWNTGRIIGWLILSANRSRVVD